MSIADQYPDYDLAFLEGSTGDDLSALSRDFGDAATQLQSQIAEIGASAEGVTASRVQGELVETRQALERSADDAGKAAAAFAAMKQAWDTWQANAPRQAAIAFAERSVEDARQRLMAADGPHAALYRRQLKMAQDKLNELIDRREAADTALAEALEAAQKMLPKGRWGERDEDDVEKNTTPGSPAPQLDAPNADTPAPGAPGPGAPGPGSAAPAPFGAAPPAELPGAGLTPPATLPSPETTPQSAPAAGLTPDQKGALLGALAQPQVQAQPQQQAAPQPQPQMAMPAMPQVPGAQQRQPENPFANANADQGLNDLLDALAPVAAVAPLTVPSLSSPAISPATVSTPVSAPQSFGPATSWNTPSSGLSTAPLVNPVVTGNSISGLTTDNNVTGRPDGTPARTATSPSPASHLATATSAAHAEPTNTTTRGAAGGMGHGMMPMMPMMGGPGMGGVAAADKRDPVTAKLSPDQAELMGLETVAEAVPGGTIARKED